MQTSMQQAQYNPAAVVDPNSFELRRCPFHPNYHVEVFCPKEGLEPSVMCIKCYLDPEISKKFNDEPLLALKDIIVKSVDKNNGKMSTQKSQLLGDRMESLEQKFLEFNTRDYLGIFERHVESQMKKLDQELDRMRDSLNAFREKFVQFYEKQLENLKAKEEEIKQKVTHYIEEKEEADQRSFRSLDDVLRELNTLTDFNEYQRFIKILYKKSQYSSEDEEGSSLKKIIDMMTNMRTLTANMKTIKIDTTILEDIRARIDSMDIVDKSARIPGVTSVDSQVQSVLDRIRKAEKRFTPQGKTFTTQQIYQSGDRDSEKETYEGAVPYKKVNDTPKFTKLLEALKEKERPSPFKDKYPSRSQMDVEGSKEKEYPRPGFSSQVNFSPRTSMDIEKPLTKKDLEFPIPKRDISSTPGRKEQEFQTPRRDQGHTPGKSSLKKDRPHGTPKERRDFSDKDLPFELPLPVVSEPEDKKNLLERLREKYKLETAKRSMTKQSSDKEDTASQNQQSQEKRPVSGSVDKTSERKPSESKKAEPSYSVNWYESRNRLVDDFRATQSGGNVEDDLESAPTFSQNPSPEKSPKDTSAQGAGTSAEGGNQSHVTPFESHLKFAKTIAPGKVDPARHQDYLIDPKHTPDKSPEGLIQQWIDSKLNGYAIFQNTLRAKETDIEDDFAKYSSQKWIQLSKAERDEYTALALTQRNELREEFKKLSATTNLSELQEMLDQRIKRIRK